MSPLFDYACDNCSTEEIERVHEVMVPLEKLDTEIKCPDCGETLRRLMSAPTFRIN